MDRKFIKGFQQGVKKLSNKLLNDPIDNAEIQFDWIEEKVNELLNEPLFAYEIDEYPKHVILKYFKNGEIRYAAININGVTLSEEEIIKNICKMAIKDIKGKLE